jgi:hypothetical protein
VADFSAQAVINTILSQAFPDDPIVGEEDASDLRAPTTEASHALRARVVELADDILAQPPLTPSGTTTSGGGADSDPDSGIGGEGGERAEWGLGRRWGADALLKAIDRGNFAGGRSGRASGSSISFCSSLGPYAYASVTCVCSYMGFAYVIVQACGHSIRSTGRRGSCAVGNMPSASRY